MYDSPRSLQEACVDFICENLEALCEVAPVFQQTSTGIFGDQDANYGTNSSSCEAVF
jgi:hypothetical protein